jgi:N-acetylneuraminate synthase/N,N'-diacetyllegionaminate synthase
MNKVLIIAEAGVNHNGDFELAKKLIKAAADANADVVKFQTYTTEKMVSVHAEKAKYQSKNLKNKDSSQYSMLKKLEMPIEWHQNLHKYATQLNISFLSTAFDLDSLNFLNTLNPNCFKIPSGEITNRPYLERVASFNKPIILSTGMSTLNEIHSALEVLYVNGVDKKDITVLHCNTEYPTPMKDVNLKAMLTIRDMCKVQVGYSDHTLGIEVPIAAVALGATIIEKHLTLNRTMDGPDHAASLEPKELTQMVEGIRNIELAISGNGEKVPSPSEEKNIVIARKSLHVNRDMKIGDIITSTDIVAMRPGDGISPMEISDVIGKKIVKPLEQHSKLKWEDLS